ncbi:hypothetical protein MFRU_005g03220 [Monilinia fructicola]|nr:hypothetical protein MFRU_005g03220 [Monilinia fructicola]
MHLSRPGRALLCALASVANLVLASEHTLAPRRLCVAKDDVCRVPGVPCCDGLKCALAHGGKADVGYCTASGRLLQDYYQPRLP